MRLILILTVCFVWSFMNVYGQEKTDKSYEMSLEFMSDDGITGEIKDKILLHFRQNLPRQTVEAFLENKEDEKNLIISENDSTPFAADVKVYSLHHRSFPHWAETYTEYRGSFYTSLKKDDFEKFLKAYDFLNKSNSLNLFITAYKNFKINESAAKPDYIVDEKYLRQNQESLKRYESGNQKLAFEKIKPPTVKNDKNTIIAFYIENPLLNKITRLKVSVSPDYDFHWETKTYETK